MAASTNSSEGEGRRIAGCEGGKKEPNRVIDYEKRER